jgi:hypothetical protein
MTGNLTGDLDWGPAIRLARTLHICRLCLRVHRLWYRTLGINPTLSCNISRLEVIILASGAAVVGLTFFLTLLILL